MVKNHFTATGIVINSEKQVLMIFHNKLNVWLPPGGHVEENELPDTAVLREIFEETGIKAIIMSAKQESHLADEHCRELEYPFTILLEDIEGDGTHNHIDMIYLCAAVNEELVLQKSEVSDVGWFSFEQIAELKTFDNVKQIIRRVAQKLIVTDLEKRL